ncbi:MAG TPA: InlB B-repeat-containing protein [Methanocorpusculum sp.]|nr:InlB B-repeat-containing protein [Methanocorpusculum sp.]
MYKQTDEGVSPVIATVLVVGLIVVLAAIVTPIALNTVANFAVQEKSTVGVTIQISSDDNKMTVNLINGKDINALTGYEVKVYYDTADIDTLTVPVTVTSQGLQTNELNIIDASKAALVVIVGTFADGHSDLIFSGTIKPGYVVVPEPDVETCTVIYKIYNQESGTFEEVGRNTEFRIGMNPAYYVPPVVQPGCILVWYNDSGCTVQWSGVVGPEYTNKELTLYGQWIENAKRYEVRYSVNGVPYGGVDECVAGQPFTVRDKFTAPDGYQYEWTSTDVNMSGLSVDRTLTMPDHSVSFSVTVPVRYTIVHRKESSSGEYVEEERTYGYGVKDTYTPATLTDDLTPKSYIGYSSPSSVEQKKIEAEADGYTGNAVVYLDYPRKTYTIKYDMNRKNSNTYTKYDPSSVTAPGDTSIKFEEEKSLPATTLLSYSTYKTGNKGLTTYDSNPYYFIGWSTTSSGSSSFYDRQVITLDEDLIKELFSNDTKDTCTLYGNWSQYVAEITFNAGEGTIPQIGSSTYLIYLDRGSSSGTSVTLPNSLPVASRSGFDFEGWERSGGSSVSGGTKLTGLSSPYDVRLDAKWSEIAFTYKIKLLPNGGILADGIAAEKEVGGREVFNLPGVEQCTRDGYVLSGWQILDGNQAGVTKNPGESVSALGTENQQIQIEAVWEQAYSITYNLNSGSWVGDYTAPAAYVSSAGVTLPDSNYITRSDSGNSYKFGGWCEDSACSGTAVSQIPVGASGNKEYYAKWIPTITYELNSGSWKSGYTAPDSYTEGVGVSLPTKDNVVRSASGKTYKFLGWYDNSAFTGSPVTAIYVIDKGCKKFYAKWDEPYTITYTVAGDVFAVKDSSFKTYYSSEGKTLPVNDDLTNQDSYYFEGWYGNSDFSGSKVTAIPAGTTGNKVYYAKYTVIKKYTIKYDLNPPTNSGWIKDYEPVKPIPSVTSGVPAVSSSKQSNLLNGAEVTLASVSPTTYKLSPIGAGWLSVKTYSFGGWKPSSGNSYDAGAKITLDSSTLATTLKPDDKDIITLTAIWNKN